MHHRWTSAMCSPRCNTWPPWVRITPAPALAAVRESYSNHFTCIPFDVPARTPCHPQADGSGSANGSRRRQSRGEIFTDKYGRVKVQFHWDREGQRNENSSCWVRVSHPWAR